MTDLSIYVAPSQTISSNGNAAKLLEEARVSHENFLIRHLDSDLEHAVECYIDAIKTDPTQSESYYRLASLLLIKGQISVEGAIDIDLGSMFLKCMKQPFDHGRFLCLVDVTENGKT